MRKLLSLALVALTAASAWAVDVNFDFGTAQGQQDMGYNFTRREMKTYITEAAPLVYQGITVTGQGTVFVTFDDDGDRYLRVNKGASITFAAPDDAIIESMEVTYMFDDDGGNITFDSGYFDEPDDDLYHGYWEGEANAVTFTTTGSSAPYIVGVLVSYLETVTGITTVEVKQEQSVRYYNLAGQESSTPFEGVNIRVARMADGTVSTTKLVK